MFDGAIKNRQAFCRTAGLHNGRIRRAAVQFCAAVGAGVLIGQVIDILLYLSR